MSGVFDLDPRGQAAQLDNARQNPLDLNAAPDSLWQGTPKAIGLGTIRGGARVAQTAGLALAAPVSLYERVTDQEGRYTDPYFRTLDEYATSAVDYWTPDAGTVGKAGQVLGSFAEIALPLMAGGGNPAPLIGTQTMGTAADLVREGVSAPAATAVGVLQGAATGVGFALPFFGKSLAQRMVSGVLGNVAVNASTTAAQAAVLRAAGAERTAEGFDWADPTARAVDVLTGLAFGALAHVSAPRLKPSEIDAALTANNARNFQEGSAPGKPADFEASVLHQQSMKAATEQLVAGDPVSVPAAVAGARFDDTPAMRAKRAEIEATMRAEMQQLREAYGNVLERPQGPATDPLVMIRHEDIEAVAVARGGWKGVGDLEVKGSGWGLVKFIWKHGEKSAERPELQISSDDITAFPQVIRDFTPSRPAATDGSVGREWRVERTGPAGQPRVIVYADNAILGQPDRHLVTVHVERPDRSGGAMSEKRGPDASPESSGRVWESPPRDTAPGVLAQTGRDLPAGESVLPAGAGARGASATTAEPVAVQAARQAAAAPDVVVATGALDAEGRPQIARAADVLGEADAAVQRAQSDAQGFLAAVTCFLSRGL